MADRRPSAQHHPDGGRGLAARLRREAGASRPAFSASLHEQVCAAVATASPAPGRAGRRERPRAITIAGGLVAAAALAAALVGGGWRSTAGPALPAADAVATSEMPGIERLPTPGEIGAGVLAEVTTLAAAAVGVPQLTDLAAFDPAAFAAADDAGR